MPIFECSSKISTSLFLFNASIAAKALEGPPPIIAISVSMEFFSFLYTYYNKKIISTKN
ncbi:MAG: hypothetical protein ACFFCM_00165 [Promethearchaeota archaeon]